MTNIIGKSDSDKWYTPTPLYADIVAFYDNRFVDVAADREAIEYRRPHNRPDWYVDHDGLKQWTHGPASWAEVSRYAGLYGNPPGGKDRMLKYRMFDQYADQATKEDRELIWLVYNVSQLQPLVKRYPEMVARMHLLVFRDRLQYEGNGGTGNFFGSAMLYLPNSNTTTAEHFRSYFGGYGAIYQPA